MVDGVSGISQLMHEDQCESEAATDHAIARVTSAQSSGKRWRAQLRRREGDG